MNKNVFTIRGTICSRVSEEILKIRREEKRELALKKFFIKFGWNWDYFEKSIVWTPDYMDIESKKLDSPLYDPDDLDNIRRRYTDPYILVDHYKPGSLDMYTPDPMEKWSLL